MPFSQALELLDYIQSIGLDDPPHALDFLGELGAESLATLESQCRMEPISWTGTGAKKYKVFTLLEDHLQFSRVVNEDLAILDAEVFLESWSRLVGSLSEAAGELRVRDGVRPEDLDRLLYTLPIAFAAGMDLFGGGNRKAAGTLFEIMMGAIISVLTGRGAKGQIKVWDRESSTSETIPVDIHFPPGGQDVTLVVATKLSTRERISQAYVHQRMLDVLRPGEFRSIVVACNENNIQKPKRLPDNQKTPDRCSVTETLVPGTIRHYERYIAHLEGIYYADPPQPFLKNPDGLPPVKLASKLLTGDLADVLR